MIEISFNTRLLRDICENKSKAENILGQSLSKKLRHRLADFRAVDTVSELFIGNPRNVILNGNEVFIVSLNTDSYIVFTANHRRNPLNDDDTIDWNKVSRVKIISIGNEYEI